MIYSILFDSRYNIIYWFWLEIKLYVALYVTLYSIHSRVGSENPVVKTLCCPFFAEFRRHCVEWQKSTPRFASTPERRNENINLNKYLICSSGDRIPEPSRYSLLCARYLVKFIIMEYFNYQS